MKVGIICAGDSEVAPFLGVLKNTIISQKAMLTFYSGTIENIPVVTLFCGVGKTNAAIATEILIDTYQCDLIINAGTAGAMNEGLKIFDTVISTESGYWDLAEDVLTDFHPYIPSIYFKADETLINQFKEVISKYHLENVYFGRMVTGEMFIEKNIEMKFIKISYLIV